MKYFEISNVSESRLERLVGAKSKDLLKGSPGLFIQAYQAEDVPTDLKGAKVNFEVRERGLLLYISKSSRQWVMAIPVEELVKVALQGAHLSIEQLGFVPLTLLLDTEDIDLALSVSGSNDDSLSRFAKRLEAIIQAEKDN